MSECLNVKCYGESMSGLRMLQLADVKIDRIEHYGERMSECEMLQLMSELRMLRGTHV
jgi:hypothetical protein